MAHPKHDRTRLLWLTGWDWKMFQNSEEYGVLYLFDPSDKAPRSWLVYDKFSGVVVATTLGSGIDSILGMPVHSPDFVDRITAQGHGFRIAA